jgi:hypothetical protein
MRYSSILRCIGQSLEDMGLKSIEVKTHGNNIIVQAWNRSTSMAMDLEKHYTPENLRELEAEGRAKRRPSAGPPNMLSLSQVFRLAGNYVDRMGGRLIRVSWQDQSDKIQSLTVQWKTVPEGKETAESQGAKIVDELCIHIYKQRKKINLSSERQTHRPFVSVGRTS